jgi:hypothetical protein
MSEIELLTSMQSNRAIFVNYVLVQTLMAAVIVYVAYMFRTLPTVVKAAAVVCHQYLIGNVLCYRHPNSILCLSDYHE